MRCQAEDQRAHMSAEPLADKRADDGARKDDDCDAPKHHSQDARRSRPERQPQPDFSPSSADGIGRNPVQPAGCEQQGEGAKEPGHHGEDAFVGQCRVELRSQRPEREGEVGVDVTHGPGEAANQCRGIAGASRTTPTIWVGGTRSREPSRYSIIRPVAGTSPMKWRTNASFTIATRGAADVS